MSTSHVRLAAEWKREMNEPSDTRAAIEELRALVRGMYYVYTYRGGIGRMYREEIVGDDVLGYRFNVIRRDRRVRNVAGTADIGRTRRFRTKRNTTEPTAKKTFCRMRKTFRRFEFRRNRMYTNRARTNAERRA